MSDEQKTAPQETAQQDEASVNGAAPAEAAATETAATEAAAIATAETEAVETETAETPLAAPAAEAEAPATPKPATTVSLQDHTGADDSDDEDEDEDDFDGDEDDDDSHYVDGPAEYIQREKSGRARRIGSDIRVSEIDYKNIPMLSRFLDRRGRILSRRKTKVSAKVQRTIVKAIKRARHLALLPYTGDHTRIVQKRGR